MSILAIFYSNEIDVTRFKRSYFGMAKLEDVVCNTIFIITAEVGIETRRITLFIHIFLDFSPAALANNSS